MNRSNMYLLIAGLFLLPSLLFAAGEKERAQDGELTAEVVFLEGEMTVDGRSAREGDIIPGQSIVETGAGSFCELLFDDGNILRIEEHTLLRLSLQRQAPGLELQRGALAAVFERLDLFGGGKSFQLSSPSMSAGIRGTIFYLRVEDPETSYLCTCRGRILQSDSENRGPRRLVEATHHTAYRYSRSPDGAFRSQRAAKLYHSDEALESLAKKVDLEIRWEKPLE